MNRRNFLSIVTGAVAAALLPKTSLPWWMKPRRTPFIPAVAGTYTYHYVYRNRVTGCCSNPSPVAPPAHTFMMPEHDVMDMYRLQDNGEFEWMVTIL